MVGDRRAGGRGPRTPGVAAGGARVGARGRRAGASGVGGGARAAGASGGGGAPSSRRIPPRSGSFALAVLRAPGTARGARQISFFGRATGTRGLKRAGTHLVKVRRVGRSKSIEAQTYWSAGTASSAYARMVSSNLAGRDYRLAILQPGTERLAGDGAWWGVWLRVIRACSTVPSGPRRANLRRRAPIFWRNLGVGEGPVAVAVVVEYHQSGSYSMGRSRGRDLCAGACEGS